MAKAKYKVDTLVEYGREGQPTAHGVITAQIVRNTFVQYMVDDHPEFVEESEIKNAYRPVAAKKPKAKSEKAANPKKKTATAPQEARSAVN